MAVRNPLEVLERILGNLEPIGATLTDILGTALNLTGKTIKFRMTLLVSPFTVVVSAGSATLDNAASGQVSYSPTSGDIDTVGLYGMWFWDDDTIDRLWPYDGASFQLHIVNEYERH